MMHLSDRCQWGISDVTFTSIGATSVATNRRQDHPRKPFSEIFDRSPSDKELRLLRRIQCMAKTVSTVSTYSRLDLDLVGICQCRKMTFSFNRSNWLYSLTLEYTNVVASVGIGPLLLPRRGALVIIKHMHEAFRSSVHVTTLQPGIRFRRSGYLRGRLMANTSFAR